MSKQITALVALIAALAATAHAAIAAPADANKTQLVRTIMDKNLGEVLTTGNKQAIYVWSREPKGKVKCTGACATAWPPVMVKAGVVVAMHVKGIKGDFGTVRRPDGSRQLTFNQRPLYTYANEKPSQVKCNNVQGWFAVKVHA
jgi:predicted lipoprotein with Yx(FWY)xxD motif